MHHGAHYQGLAQAARKSRGLGLISNPLCKKLCMVDSCFALLRHITGPSTKSLIAEVDAALGAPVDLDSVPSSTAGDVSSATPVLPVLPRGCLAAPAQPQCATLGIDSDDNMDNRFMTIREKACGLPDTEPLQRCKASEGAQATADNKGAGVRKRRRPAVGSVAAAVAPAMQRLAADQAEAARRMRDAETAADAVASALQRPSKSEAARLRRSAEADAAAAVAPAMLRLPEDQAEAARRIRISETAAHAVASAMRGLRLEAVRGGHRAVATRR